MDAESPNRSQWPKQPMAGHTLFAQNQVIFVFRDRPGLMQVTVDESCDPAVLEIVKVRLEYTLWSKRSNSTSYGSQQDHGYRLEAVCFRNTLSRQNPFLWNCGDRSYQTIEEIVLNIDILTFVVTIFKVQCLLSPLHWRHVITSMILMKSKHRFSTVPLQKVSWLFCTFSCTPRESVSSQSLKSLSRFDDRRVGPLFPNRQMFSWWRSSGIDSQNLLRLTSKCPSWPKIKSSTCPMA